MQVQNLMRLVYPPQCIACSDQVETYDGLCGKCWPETPFITGTVCDCCGVPLPEAQDESGTEDLLCDDCLDAPRAWTKGRAALIYRGAAKRMVLSFKHGDRLDLAEPAARWLHGASQKILEPDMLIAPVPIHWLRMLKRRYNQSAVLAQAFANETGLAYAPDLFSRPVRTRSQDGLTVAERQVNLANAITVNPKRRRRLIGRKVLIIDDVMTTGATLNAAAGAALAAGAHEVRIAALARAVRNA